MAICRNCGAQYSDGEDRCPYCGASHAEEAGRIVREDLREFERQREEVKALPKKQLKKRTKAALIVLAALAAAVLIWAAAGRIWGDASLGRKAAREDEATETMESYFQAGEYQELYDYYLSRDSHSPSDEKYWEAASAWSWMEFMRETKAALSGTEESYGYYGISYALSGCAEALRTIEQGLDDGIERGNEEVLREFEEEILTFFREDLKMSEEEIEAVKTMEEESDFEAMDARIMERLGLD